MPPRSFVPVVAEADVRAREVLEEYQRSVGIPLKEWRQSVTATRLLQAFPIGTLFAAIGLIALGRALGVTGLEWSKVMLVAVPFGVFSLWVIWACQPLHIRHRWLVKRQRILEVPDCIYRIWHRATSGECVRSADQLLHAATYQRLHEVNTANSVHVDFVPGDQA